MTVYRRDDFYSGGGVFTPPTTRNEVNGSFAQSEYIPLSGYSRGDNPNITNPAAATVTIEGQIDILNDVDVYRFEVSPDEVGLVSYVFDIDDASTANNSGLDTQLRLFNSGFVSVGESDDSFNPDSGSVSSRDSYLTFTPTTAGTYYIAVTSYNNDWTGGGVAGGNSTGSYDLHVSVTGTLGIQTYGDGTLGDDSIYGDSNGVPANDTMYGYAGNDSIAGDGGADTIFGGDGSDDLFGGEGNDTIGGDDVPFGDFEGPGDEDRIRGEAGDDALAGGQGDDLLEGGIGRDAFRGGLGNDRIDGGAGADYFVVEDDFITGQDTFVLRTDDSTLTSQDAFLYTAAYSYVGPAPFFVIVNVPAVLSFHGAGVAGGDLIEFVDLPSPVFWSGFVGNAVTAGNPLPGGGNGVLDGVYTGNSAQTWLVIDSNDDGLVSTSDFVVRFDWALTLIPTDFLAGQVVASVSGDALDNSFIGLGGADFYKAGAGADDVVGGGGADLLYGEAGADELSGGQGNDSLNGDTQDDVLKGGEGLDTLVGGAGFDAADYRDKLTPVTATLNAGGLGTATVAGLAEDRLFGVEAIYGGAGADVLTGDGLGNLFRGGGGADVINGFGGLDTIDFREKSATVVLRLTGPVNATATVAGVAEDVVRNVENILGGAAGDVLTGDNLANALAGGGGNDVLRGGGGADRLTGGLGADRFLFGTIAESTVAVAGRDTVLDFSPAQTDRIDVSAIDANSVLAGNQAFTIGSVGVAGRLQVTTVVAGSIYLVQGDVDGGGADFGIVVNATSLLNAADFVL